MTSSLRCLVIPSDAVFGSLTPLRVLELDQRSDAAEHATQLRDLVGGYLEVFRLRNDTWLYLNENGKALELPENLVATSLAHAAGLSMADFVAGQVVAVGAPDEAGFDTSVPDELLVFLEGLGCVVEGRSG